MNWTDAVIQGYGLWDQLDRYDEINQYTQEELGALRGEAITGTQFTPFTVASSIGSMTGGPDGVNVNLSPDAQAQMDTLQRFGNDFFGSAAGDQSAREQAAYDSIRALQEPEEQRQMLATEARAAAQGRLDVSGANYAGSTPEMLAMQERIGQNQRAAAVSAIEQARAQQAQDGSLAQIFQSSSYMPLAQSQNLFNQGLQVANMNQAGQIAGNNLSTQLGISQIQSQVNTEQIRAELMANLFRTIGGAASANNFDPLGQIGGAFGNWLGGIFS